MVDILYTFPRSIYFCMNSVLLDLDKTLEKTE